MTIIECRPSSKCGGGSGTLLAKQCKRMLEAEVGGQEQSDAQARYARIYALAEEKARQAHAPSEFLARCGIVIQSDLIHKQNEGVHKEDNLAGLFRTTARNYMIDVLGNRELSPQQAIGTGGVFNNLLIKAELEKAIGLTIQRPDYFENIGAIGIACKGMDAPQHYVLDMKDLDAVAEQGRNAAVLPRRLALICI